jgi:uncharacterized RDD family membrane protein YckC
MQPTVSPTTAPPKPAPVVETTLASRGSRFFAAVVDSAAILVVYLVAYALNTPAFLFLGVLAVAAIQIYYLSVQGQTIGKMVMNIRIVNFHTNENGGFVPNVLMRGILNGLLGFIPFYALVDVLFIFRDDRRCIHDLIAGTKVIEA